MTRAGSTLVAAGALGMAFVAGFALQRSRTPEGPLAAGEGAVVIRFRDHDIRADQARAALEAQRVAVRAGAGSAKEVVEELAHTRILALRAEGGARAARRVLRVRRACAGAERGPEDPRTAARNGELGETTRQALESAMGPEVAAAAFSMPEPGIHEAVLESASGFHVLRVLGREEAYEPRLEDVRERLAARVASERTEARRKALIDEAWTEAEVTIDEAALEKIVAELRSARP